MDSDATQSRWDEIKQIWQEWKILYVIVGFIAGLLTFPALQLILADLNEFLSSLVPEAFGIAFTVFLIDRLYSQRDEKRRIWEHKQRLIRETGSTSNEIARNAIDELRSLDWLEGENGILRGTRLIAANLAGARLYEANFEGADLSGAKLKSASLSDAMMRNANLSYADFTGSTAYGVDFTNAQLFGADLRGALLLGATMINSSIQEAKFDETTQLPNGSKWQVDTDMVEFGCVLN